MLELTFDKRVRNVSAFAARDDPRRVGRSTVTPSSTMLVGAPIRAEKSRSRLYTIHHRLLQREAKSESTKSSGTWRLMPST